MWELDCKEGREPNNWCVRTMVLDKTPEIPLDSKEIKPVNLKGNQPWILVGRTDAEVEALYFGHLMWTADSLKNSLMCWVRLMAEGEEGISGWEGWMASPMQWTWTWANSGRWWGKDRQACYSSWGCKESGMTGWLNNSNNQVTKVYTSQEILLKQKNLYKVLTFTQKPYCAYHLQTSEWWKEPMTSGNKINKFSETLELPWSKKLPPTLRPIWFTP